MALPCSSKRFPEAQTDQAVRLELNGPRGQLVRVALMTPRADALRNRAALLAAAEAEFAAHGAEASVAEIARRAGIGKGTVFRHFPTKDDLLAAVVLDRIDGLAA